jgi:hypothetical protein
MAEALSNVDAGLKDEIQRPVSPRLIVAGEVGFHAKAANHGLQADAPSSVR